MSINIGEKEYLTMSDIAKETGRSIQTITRWINDKKIPQPRRLKSNNWRVFTREQADKIIAFANQVV